MARYDFRAPRLYVDAPLAAGREVPLDRQQANYLVNVLRLGSDDPVLAFNGRDGEWRAAVRSAGRRDAALVPGEQVRPQTQPAAVDLAFAPLKHARLDYMVQKAVEMGAGRLQPVITRHTQVARVNRDRMQANVIEAAEQCGIITLPEVDAPLSFDRFLAGLPAEGLLVFCDEEAETGGPVAALADARARHEGRNPPVTLLIGPEGGFAEDERNRLLRHPNVVRLSLGPRILRADTAAVAALALVQAVLGDWVEEAGLPR
jgi:16S rRNA (uracil1498-N3)-methyltransferase